MKKVIVIALLLCIALSSLAVNVVEGVKIAGVKIATPAALEPGENLTIHVTLPGGMSANDLYSLEIRDKVPDGFELISGNTSMNISVHDLNSMVWEPVELSYVLKAQKPGVFLLDPLNVTFKDNPEDAAPISRNSNRFEVYVIDPATMTLEDEAYPYILRRTTDPDNFHKDEAYPTSTYPYSLYLGYFLDNEFVGETYKINFKSHPEVLKIDEITSSVLNLETVSKLTYEEFLNSDQFEGDRLEFNISLSKEIGAGLWHDEDIALELSPNLERIFVSRTENSIWCGEDYALELSTNLEHPKWKFGDVVSYGEKVIVWKGCKKHEREVPRVILSGTVPKQILTPNVHVTLTVGTRNYDRDRFFEIHKLKPVMVFSSISKSISPTPIASPSVTPISTPPTSTPIATPVPFTQTSITPSPTATATEFPTPEKGVPGFKGIFAIMGLLAVAYLLIRRK